MAQRRRRRTSHVGLGALAQPPAPPQLPRRHPARGVRGGLRCPTSRPRTGWKPINRASTKPSAIQRTKLASEVNPNTAARTARVTNSASDSFGTIPTAGRGGAHPGCATNRSSILTYSAVTRVSKFGFMPRSSRIGSCFTSRSWTPSTTQRRTPLLAPLGTTHRGAPAPSPADRAQGPRRVEKVPHRSSVGSAPRPGFGLGRGRWRGSPVRDPCPVRGWPRTAARRRRCGGGGP